MNWGGGCVAYQHSPPQMSTKKHFILPNYKNMIDEDGELLISNQQAILDMLTMATEVKAWYLGDLGNKETELTILDWDGTANSEQGISDIVIEGDRFTIFHDELDEAVVHGNTFTIGDKLFEVI